MYLADCHTHTQISPDSRARLRDQAQAAVDAGLDGLWVTDHFDLVDRDGHPRTAFDWPAAFRQFDDAREALGDALELRLGLELGSAPYDPELARRVLAGGGERLDFVLGSLHNWIGAMDNRDFFDTGFTDDPALCRRAMENDLDNTWALVSAYPDCYDSLAHLDYPTRYMVRDGQSVTLADYEERVRVILTEVARTDHALELNTCRGTDLAAWPPILRWFRQCGGRYATVGSDAHRPADVAKGIREGIRLIGEAGLSYTVFRGRRPCVVQS